MLLILVLIVMVVRKLTIIPLRLRGVDNVDIV